jgi:hypothetical protein
VEGVVKYTDTDQNGFLDTIEYDYDGDRGVDLRVSLLDYRTSSNPHPDVVPLIDTHQERWQGLNVLFGKITSQSFQEALLVYDAAWRRGLTTPEMDKLASASTIGERYDHGYWLKEKSRSFARTSAARHWRKISRAAITPASLRNTPAASLRCQADNLENLFSYKDYSFDSWPIRP